MNGQALRFEGPLLQGVELKLTLTNLLFNLLRKLAERLIERIAMMPVFVQFSRIIIVQPRRSASRVKHPHWSASQQKDRNIRTEQFEREVFLDVCHTPYISSLLGWVPVMPTTYMTPTSTIDRNRVAGADGIATTNAT